MTEKLIKHTVRSFDNMVCMPSVNKEIHYYEDKVEVNYYMNPHNSTKKRFFTPDKLKEYIIELNALLSVES